MTLAPMLKQNGKLIGDFTLANLGPLKTGNFDEFFIAGSGIAEEFHMRWFEENLNSNPSNQNYDTVRITPHGTGKV